jgi:hypothetical protein
MKQSFFKKTSAETVKIELQKLLVSMCSLSGAGLPNYFDIVRIGNPGELGEVLSKPILKTSDAKLALLSLINFDKTSPKSSWRTNLLTSVATLKMLNAVRFGATRPALVRRLSAEGGCLIPLFSRLKISTQVLYSIYKFWLARSFAGVEYIHQIIFKGPIELLLRCKHAQPTDFFKRKERPNEIIKLQAQQKNNPNFINVDSIRYCS